MEELSVDASSGEVGDIKLLCVTSTIDGAVEGPEGEVVGGGVRACTVAQDRRMIGSKATEDKRDSENTN